MDRLKQYWNENVLLLQTSFDRFNDVAYVTIKDKNTGKKELIKLESPRVPVYFANKELNITNYRENIRIEDCYVVWCNYRYRQWDIARELGMDDFTKKVRSGALKPNDVYLSKRLFLADVSLEDLIVRDYVMYFIKPTDDGLFSINLPIIDRFHIGALDIETDILISDNREEQPINVITYIDDKTLKGYTVFTKNENYSGQDKVIADLEGFKQKVKDVFITTCDDIDIAEDNPKKKASKEADLKKLMLEMIDKLDLEIKVVDDEVDMIKDVNNYVFNKANPDFLYIFNAKYDISQQQMRAKTLGFDFDTLFKFKDVDPFTNYRMDDERIDPAKRSHHYYSSNPTKILDQMLVYYQLRRSKEFSKWSLDATVQREAGRGKLNYSHICNYIGDLPYKDYETFLIYNIIDVFVMLILDRITNDTIAQVYTRFNLACDWGNISSPLKRTTSIFDTFSFMQGIVPSNENNKLLLGLTGKQIESIKDKDHDLFKMVSQLKAANTEKPEDNPYRIKGGLVTSPNLINPDIKPSDDVYKILIKTYNKLVNCADLDATAMYPSNTEVNNASKSTLIGIMNKVNEETNPELSQKLALSIINENLLSIGNLFFNLPSSETLITDYNKLEMTYKNRTEINDTFIKHKEFNIKPDKTGTAIIKMYNALYNTNYKDKDIEAGTPSRNKLIIASSGDYVKFSYYGTKIELKLSVGTFNEYLRPTHNGEPITGFFCGNHSKKEEKITNLNNEYIEYMYPTKENFTVSEVLLSGSISMEQKEAIKLAKVKSYNLVLGDYKINLLNRTLFMYLDDYITYEIYSINEDDNLFLIKFNQIYIIKEEMNVNITQSVIFYKQ